MKPKNNPYRQSDLVLVKNWLTKLFGNRGERRAARYLKRNGFRILARQYQNHIGEIDIIALDGNTVVFVEVKTRKSHNKGAPYEAVHQAKQNKIAKIALVFLKAQGWLDRSCRFDIVSVTWPEHASQPEIVHYPHAFEPDGIGQLYS